MLDDLRFVAAAVAKKDYVQDLTHFKINDGRVMASNGRLTLCSPINVAFDVRPHAASFLVAVRACEGAISLTRTAAGKLTVRAGKFRSHVNCLDDDATEHYYEPAGQEVELGDTFMTGLRLLSPLMGIDASRPWSMGIRLSASSMFATNNVMVGEFWHGKNMPIDAVIPAQAVDQLLRIGENPTKIQVTENAVSFWFGDKRWMRTTLIEAEQWPDDRIASVLNGIKAGVQVPITEAFKEAVAAIKPFLEKEKGNVVYLYPDRISTSTEDEQGSSVEVDNGDIPLQAYAHKQLEILCEVASTIDWTAYPAPAMFKAQALRGVVVGQRV